MDTHIPDVMVRGHAQWVDRVQLPDPDDCHVVSAAIAAGATLIVTFNLRDFPAPALAPFDIDAIHPDGFIVQLLDEQPAFLRSALAIQRRLVKPPVTFEAYVARLEELGLPSSAEILRRLATRQ